MSDAGTVNVKFTVSNAEVVRQALTNLGKDGEKALKQFDASAKPASESAKTLGVVLDGVRDKARGFAEQSGGVGSALLRFGPAGLAAAAGLGVAYLAIDKLNEVAEKFAEKAQGFRDTAAAIGTTTLQYQALVDAGGKVGLTTDTVNQALGRLGSAAYEARDAQGALFEQVRKINPELAQQLLTARDTGEAIDIVAKAYQAASSAQEKLALSRTISRDPTIGNLLQQITAAGGVNGLSRAFAPEAIPDETIRKAAALRVEIAQIRENTENVWGEAFGTTTLESQRASAKLWNDIAKEIKDAVDWLGRWNDLHAQSGRLPVPSVGTDQFGGTGLEFNPPPNVSAEDQRLARIRELSAAQKTLNSDLDFYRFKAQQTEQQNPWKVDDVRTVENLEKELGKVNAELDALQKKKPASRVEIDLPTGAATPLPQANPLRAVTDGSDQRKVSAEAELNIYRQTIAVLGQAATPAEAYRLRLLEINSALEKNAVSQDTANRGLSAFVLAQQQVAAATRERIGVLSQEELLSTRLAELQDLRAKGFIKSDDEMRAAEALVRKEVKDTMEALAVRNSSTPQLTQLAVDAGDLQKQLDQGLATSLRSITSEFSILNNSSATFGQRLQNVGLKMADMVIQATLMKVAVAPLAGLFSGGLASLFSFAEGGVMTNSGPVPLKKYAAGGIATGPQVALFGEKPGVAEAYVPLPDGRKIPVNINAGAGLGGRPSLTQTIVVSGATGNDEVKKMVAAGVSEANSRASAMLSDYDRDVLPARLPDIQERML